MSMQSDLDFLKSVFEEMFEIDPSEVQLESSLYDDLEIDSIDAIDLIVRIKEETGQNVAPEEFKEVRSVQDVVDAMARLREAA